ncbi:cytochrome C assembly protein [Macrococcus hajekii]|uniref:Cytochrome C assembly protein n=1 Tax=Macrococcus hajekii TaxID=198482 RepID=A0A4R6BMA5_9STAP|nr:cytochrome c biogenesis protein CcsA [Macrococcus hajekii]TDM02787.1 cytochrome C assembly protein [Macrococcus hajekii]GGB03884.1 cytochrome c assembly protein [Macrococcus hajekii]
MSELLTVRINEAILFIYMLSIACYFLDFIDKNNRIKKIGFMILIVVLILQTAMIAQFYFTAGRFPVQTVTEGFYFFTWLIIITSIVMSQIARMEFLAFMMNLIGFIFMAIHTFQPVEYQSHTTVSHMMNELLMVHVTLAITAYVAFLIAAIQAMLYLYQMRNLKKKKFTQKFFRMSDLASISRSVSHFTMTGFVLLFISLVLGVQWGLILIGPSIWWDSKVIGSALILLIYGIYLFLYAQQTRKMNTLMEINIIFFLLCMINYLIISRYSEFHQLIN